MATYEIEMLADCIADIRTAISSLTEITGEGMNQVYNRINSLEEAVCSIYEIQQAQLAEQKAQTALLQQIVENLPNRCVFPEGVGLSQQELEG